MKCGVKNIDGCPDAVGLKIKYKLISKNEKSLNINDTINPTVRLLTFLPPFSSFRPFRYANGKSRFRKYEHPKVNFRFLFDHFAHFMILSVRNNKNRFLLILNRSNSSVPDRPTRIFFDLVHFQNNHNSVNKNIFHIHLSVQINSNFHKNQ